MESECPAFQALRALAERAGGRKEALAAHDAWLSGAADVLHDCAISKALQRCVVEIDGLAVAIDGGLERVHACAETEGAVAVSLLASEVVASVTPAFSLADVRFARVALACAWATRTGMRRGLPCDNVFVLAELLNEALRLSDREAIEAAALHPLFAYAVSQQTDGRDVRTRALVYAVQAGQLVFVQSLLGLHQEHPDFTLNVACGFAEALYRARDDVALEFLKLPPTLIDVNGIAGWLRPAYGNCAFIPITHPPGPGERNCGERNQISFLSWAARSNRAVLVRALLQLPGDYGLDVNALDYSGKTAFEFAVQAYHTEVIRTFADYAVVRDDPLIPPCFLLVMATTDLPFSECFLAMLAFPPGYIDMNSVFASLVHQPKLSHARADMIRAMLALGPEYKLRVNADAAKAVRRNISQARGRGEVDEALAYERLEDMLEEAHKASEHACTL
jgi:hypothetical protein